MTLYSLPFIYLFLSGEPFFQKTKAFQLIKDDQFDEVKVITASLSTIVDAKNQDKYQQAYKMYKESANAKRTRDLCQVLYSIHMRLLQLQYFVNKTNEEHSILWQVYITAKSLVKEMPNIPEFITSVRTAMVEGRVSDAVVKSQHLINPVTLYQLQGVNKFLSKLTVTHENVNEVSVNPPPNTVVNEIVDRDFENAPGSSKI